MFLFDLFKSTEHVSRITENILQENAYRNFDITSKLSLVTLSSFKHDHSILCNTTVLETLDGCGGGGGWGTVHWKEDIFANFACDQKRFFCFNNQK